MKQELKYGVFVDKKLYALFRYIYDAKRFGLDLENENQNHKITYLEVK